MDRQKQVLFLDAPPALLEKTNKSSWPATAAVTAAVPPARETLACGMNDAVRVQSANPP